MYTMLYMRVDVLYILNICSRYQSDISEKYWTTIKNILKYLKRTKDIFLVYGGDSELIMRGYNNSSF